MENNNIEVFPGKSLSSLLEDIYNITRDKRRELKTMISDTSEMIKTPADAINLGPIVHQYYEASIKNDEQLTKIATVIQRLVSSDKTAKANGTGDVEDILTDGEKEQLIKNAAEQLKLASGEIEQQLLSLNESKPKITS